MSKISHFISKIFLNKPVILKIIHGANNYIRNNGTCKDVTLVIEGNNNQVIIGSNTRVNNGQFYIRGNNHKIIIGENCFFNKIHFWVEDENCTIIIHNQVTVQQAAFSVVERFSTLTIGEDCMISNNVQIRTSDSHSILDIETGTRINRAANVTIENHVWLAANTIVLKGVSIEENTVIGTGSVVTSNIPANSIAAGNPAKVVRSGLNWDRKTY